MAIVFVKEGQSRCANCGSDLVVDESIDDRKVLGFSSVYCHCPNPECNMGTIARFEASHEYYKQITVKEVM
jgi:hypothetical protein